MKMLLPYTPRPAHDDFGPFTDEVWINVKVGTSQEGTLTTYYVVGAPRREGVWGIVARIRNKRALVAYLQGSRGPDSKDGSTGVEYFGAEGRHSWADCREPSKYWKFYAHVDDIDPETGEIRQGREVDVDDVIDAILADDAEVTP